MINARTVFLALATAALALGCGSSPSGGATSFSGSYQGTYTGTTEGALEMDVDASLETMITASVAGQNYSAGSTLSQDGTLSFGLGIGQGVVVTFTGRFTRDSRSATGSGNWTGSDGGHGTWTAVRN
jgi:hypothetical protein